MGYVDGASLYEYVGSGPVDGVDPMGLTERVSGTKSPNGGGRVVVDGGDTGTVTVWVDVTFKDRTLSDGIQLEFKLDEDAKRDCSRYHWIQFQRVTIKESDGTKVNDPVIYTTKNVYKFINEIYVDAAITNDDDVYYDTEGSSIRTASSLSMFDRPSNVHTRAEVVSQFDAYLVSERTKTIYWHVHWEWISKKDKDGEWSDGLANVSGEKTDRFLEAMQGKSKWLLGYGKRSTQSLSKLEAPVERSNPLSK